MNGEQNVEGYILRKGIETQGIGKGIVLVRSINQLFYVKRRKL
jgi:hypothetical protein